MKTGMNGMNVQRTAGLLREEEYLSRIQRHYEVLSERERRVADVLTLNTHEKNLNCTISSLAEDAGVSEATVTRFCRALGFSGFREFKYHAMKHAAPASLGSGTQISAEDSMDTVCQKVTAQIQRITELSIDGLDRSVVEGAIEKLSQAETILFVGGGSAAGIAMSSAAVFQNMGMKALYIADDLLMFRFVTSMTERDAVVCISNEGFLKSVVDAAMAARRKKVPTICVTGTPSSLLARYADYLVLTSVEGFGNTVDLYAVLTAQLAVLNVLQMGCVIRKADEIIKNRIQNVKATEMKRYDVDTEKIQIKRMKQ